MIIPTTQDNAEGPQRPTTLDLIPTWNKWMARQGFSQNTINRYNDHLRDVARTAGPDAPISVFDVHLVLRHLDVLVERGYEGATMCNWLTATRSFCRCCIQEGHLTVDPTMQIGKWPKRADPNVRFLRVRDLVRLKESLAEPPNLSARDRFYWQRTRLTVQLMLHAGLRIGEVADLRWEYIDLESKLLKVVRGKGGRNRDIPLNTTLLAELERVAEPLRVGPVIGTTKGRPLHVKCVAHLFERQLAKRLREFGQPPVSPHQLRRAFATRLKQSQVDLDTIRRLLGHRHLNTTQRYLDGCAEGAEEAVSRIVD